MAGEFQRRITGAKAVTDVMQSVGLVPPTAIAGSNDKNAIQFWNLATQAGQQLLDSYPWAAFGEEFTVVTDGVTTSYDLPDDFNAFFNDSEWNRTTRLPALGSLEEFEWQMLKARTLGGTTIALLFRINNEKVEFYSVGSTPQTLVFPYTSRKWVVQSDGTTYRDNLTSDSDVVRYDPQLFKAALKMAWRSAKGFDVTAATAEFTRCLQAAKSKDAPGRTMSLNQRTGNTALLGSLNVPSTDYGS